MTTTTTNNDLRATLDAFPFPRLKATKTRLRELPHIFERYTFQEAAGVRDYIVRSSVMIPVEHGERTAQAIVEAASAEEAIEKVSLAEVFDLAREDETLEERAARLAPKWKAARDAAAAYFERRGSTAGE